MRLGTRAAPAVLAAGVALLGGHRAAQANGAFPESLQILLPADRPHQIVLSTNFGLFLSDDAGVTWSWTCERGASANGALYAVGASPADRLFVLADGGIGYSDDDSCTWSRAGGALGTVLGVTDFFADAVDPSRVLAVAALRPSGGQPGGFQLFPSFDGGTSFGDPIFTAPPGGDITGVEIARAEPATIYLALSTKSAGATAGASAGGARWARSSDGGRSFAIVDVTPELGASTLRIAAVDPVDPRVVYVRVVDPAGDRLAVTRDGGDSFTSVLSLAGGSLTAFARLASGTILVAGAVGPEGRAFRSSDGGATFAEWTGAPHLRALTERDGLLYAAAANYIDYFAIGVSTDEGLTFQPLTRYEQVGSVRACARAVCASSCTTQAARQIWAASVCGGGGVGVGGGGGGGGARPAPTRGSGCACAAPGPPPYNATSAALLVLALVVARFARARGRR